MTTVGDLRELERVAADMADEAAKKRIEYQAAADAAADPMQQYISQALEQIQGCHQRHFKRIAEAYALAVHELDR